MQVSCFIKSQFCPKAVFSISFRLSDTFATDITLLSPPKRTWFTDESEVSKEIVRPYDMATTLEALIAAVHMDGASQEQCRKIYTRFGLQHKLVGPIDRSWIWKIVRSKMDLPEKFFIGHHFKLQEGIFETQLKRLPAQKEEGIGMWGRAKRLWRRTRRLWRRTKRLWQPEKKTEKKRVSQPRSRRRVSRSATQLPRSVDPSAESTRSAATETTSPTLDVATSEIEFAPEDSPGRCENDEQAASLEQTIDRVDLAETNGAAEVSSSQLPTSSRPTKRRTGPARPEEDTSNDVESAETGAQGSNTASKEEAASPSSKDVAATGVELKVEHQSHEVSETELAEATKEDDSEQDLKQATQEMAKEAKVLQEVWHQLVLATEGRKRTTAEQQQLANLKEQRKQIIDKRSRMLNILKRSS